MRGAYRAGLAGTRVGGGGAERSRREEGKERDEGEEDAHSLCVFCELNGGEMTPAKPSDDEVVCHQRRRHRYAGVAPALDIVFPILLVPVHDGMRVRRLVGARVFRLHRWTKC